MPSPEAFISAGKPWDAKETFGRTVDAFVEFVALMSPEGRILYLNRAARAITSSNGSELRDLTGCRLQPAWVEALILEEGIPIALRDGVWRGETALLRADGREVPVHQTLLSIGSDAEPQLASVMRDLSEDKRQELERI